MSDNPRPGAIYSLDAEQAVIGSVLLSADAFDSAAALIESGDFHLIKHRWIWEAIVRLRTTHVPVDVLTVSHELQRIGKLDECGGAAYLTQLLNTVPTWLNAEAYAQIIRQASQRRRLLDAASQAARAAHDHSIEITDAISSIIGDLVRLVHQPGDLRHVSAVARELREEIELRLENPKDIYGVSTGFKDIDRITGGLQAQELGVITGKPGKGKSMFAGQLGFAVAYNVNCGGNGVAYYSLEMRAVNIVRRRLSAITGVLTRAMRTGYIPDEQLPALTQGLNELETTYNFYITDTTGWKTAALRASLSRHVFENGLKVAIIDSLEELADEFSGKMEEYRRPEILAKRVRDIARDLNVSVLAIQHITKEGMNARVARLQHAKGGSGLHHECDWMATLNDFTPATDAEERFTEAERANLATLLFDKLREENSAVRHVHLVRRPGLPAFADFQGPTP